MLTLFSVFKFLHIVAAIIWVGGVITMTLLNARLASTRNSAAIMARRWSAGCRRARAGR